MLNTIVEGTELQTENFNFNGERYDFASTSTRSSRRRSWLEFMGNYFVYFVFIGVSIFLLGMLTGYKLQPVIYFIVEHVTTGEIHESILGAYRREWQLAERKLQRQEPERTQPQPERPLRWRGDGRVEVAPGKDQYGDTMSEPSGRTASTAHPEQRMIQDRSPERGEMRGYKILENEEQTFPGDTCFEHDPVNDTYNRRAREVSIETETGRMESDEHRDADHAAGETGGRTTAEASEMAANDVVTDYLQQPPVNRSDRFWNCYENIYEWLSPDESRRAKKCASYNVFEKTEFREFMKMRLGQV